jgi:hypothetical protein
MLSDRLNLMNGRVKSKAARGYISARASMGLNADIAGAGTVMRLLLLQPWTGGESLLRLQLQAVGYGL